MDKAVRTINEGISCSYVSEPDKTVLFSQSRPTNQQATNITPTNRGRTNGRCTRNDTHCTQRCNISTQEDFYRGHSSSTCTQENNGGNHGRYQHTHRIYTNNGPYQGNPHSSGRRRKVVSKTVLSKGHPNYFSDMREGDGLVLNNDPYQDHKHSTSGQSTITNGTHRAATHIKLVHWNAQGAITKTSAIKTAIVQDDLDIVMIQDTQYKRRLDDLPNQRIHGYHTYHRTMNEGGHGMVTMIKHTILSEEAEKIHLGDGTEIWLNNKPLLLHNIYQVDEELDITTPLTREPRSIMVGDFNARDEMWCRDHNRAGRLLNEQLRNLDNFCLMNHPQVWTTINKTAIDLSLLPVDIVPLTDWSIYHGLLSDHLAVLLEIQHQHNTERVSVPKRWLTQHADWELYREHITTAATSIEWTDIDTNEANITKATLEAGELSIPKSSGEKT